MSSCAVSVVVKPLAVHELIVCQDLIELLMQPLVRLSVQRGVLHLRIEYRLEADRELDEVARGDDEHRLTGIAWPSSPCLCQKPPAVSHPQAHQPTLGVRWGSS